ncbi:MAG: TIM44-like domain-containing protein [Caldimonas sp.]
MLSGTHRAPRRAGLLKALCVGGVLVLCSREAAASALSSLTASVGLLAALAGVMAIKGWPAHFPPSALSTAGGALLVGGAAWWWRASIAARVAGLTLLSPMRRAAALPARAVGGIGSAVATLPAGFERNQLLAELRRHFVQMQEAWDLDAGAALEALTTPELLDELRRECAQTAERGRTEIVTLHAELIGFESLAGAIVASVDYSGLMREAPDRGATVFRELRMLTRSNDGADKVWRLARHQTLW